MVASSSAVLVAAAGGTAVLALGDDRDALTSASTSQAQRRAAEGDSSQSPARKAGESAANAEGGGGRLLSQVADQLEVVGGSRKLELDTGVLMEGQTKRRQGLFGNKLFGGNRRLQEGLGDEEEEAEEEVVEVTCNFPDTCAPSFCECQASGNDIMACVPVLDAVCKGIEEDGKTWKLSGCVDEENYDYWHTYCDFATCVLDGGTYASCECAWYGTFCDKFEGNPEWAEVGELLEACRVKDCCFDSDGEVDVTQCSAFDDPVVEEDEYTPSDGEGADADNVSPAQAPNSARRKEYGAAIAGTAFAGWLLSFLL